MGHLASLGVPFSWSVCLIKHNMSLKSVGWWRWPVVRLYTCVNVDIHTGVGKAELTVTHPLILNALQTFSPVKYHYCVLYRLLLSIWYPIQGVRCWKNLCKCRYWKSCPLPTDQSVQLKKLVPELAKYLKKVQTVHVQFQQLVSPATVCLLRSENIKTRLALLMVFFVHPNLSINI